MPQPHQLDESSQKMTPLQIELDEIAIQYAGELAKKDEELTLLKEAMETVCADLAGVKQQLGGLTGKYSKLQEHCEIVERVSLGDRQLVHDQSKDIKMLEDRVREVIKERDAAKSRRVKEMAKRHAVREELVAIKKEYNALLRSTAETVTRGENPHGQGQDNGKNQRITGVNS
jgi:chromosome segregation ATPase